MLQTILLLWWEVGPDVGFFSNVQFYKLLDLCLGYWGALWFLCKSMDPQNTKKNTGDLSCYVSYTPDFIT